MTSKKLTKTECKDKKCSIHGNVVIRGRNFTGVIISKDINRTATVEWSYTMDVPKYERKEIRRTRVHVHNPPCIDAQIGDIVKIAETRPLSKTKNFVIIENLGKEKGFITKLDAQEEAQEVIENKERKEESKERSGE